MEFTEIGHVIKSHGLRGALVVHIHPFAQEAFNGFDTVYIEQLGTMVPYAITQVSTLNHDNLKLSLRGVSSAEEVERLKRRKIFQLLSEIQPPDEDKYTGYEVRTSAHGRIGILKNIVENVSQELLVVERKEGEDVYIPWVNEFIVSIDEDKKYIELDLPEGLLDL